MDKLEAPGSRPQNALDRSLDFHGQALKLRAARQGVLAANIANADTPGYKAADFNFAEALDKAASGAADGMQAVTKSTHQRAAGNAIYELKDRAAAQPSADGNTVDMDAERAQFADNAVRYEAALRTLNAQIKTMLSAIQG